ncbi:MAG: VOC family protein, partial [Myxococcota bacterium]
MIRSAVHHLAVVVRDVERAGEFYGAVLGLPELRRWHDDDGLRSIWFSLGDGRD